MDGSCDQFVINMVKKETTVVDGFHNQAYCRTLTQTKKDNLPSSSVANGCKSNSLLWNQFRKRSYSKTNCKCEVKCNKFAIELASSALQNLVTFGAIQ